MNPLTQIKNTQKITARETARGVSDEASWHAKYKESAYVFVGGLPYDLTEGDLLAVFAQCGEIMDVNLVRDKSTGKSKGFAFLAYEDQRSTILAVDNLNGAKVAGRIVRVDHVADYKRIAKEDEEEREKRREENGVCYAFQRGECSRGDNCRFSHDAQRNADTGWGGKEGMERGTESRSRANFEQREERQNGGRGGGGRPGGGRGEGRERNGEGGDDGTQSWAKEEVPGQRGQFEDVKGGGEGVRGREGDRREEGRHKVRQTGKGGGERKDGHALRKSTIERNEGFRNETKEGGDDRLRGEEDEGRGNDEWRKVRSREGGERHGKREERGKDDIEERRGARRELEEKRERLKGSDDKHKRPREEDEVERPKRGSDEDRRRRKGDKEYRR
ncbi:unnamed protein product [Closterium sp. Naga37s-1]|nr:unnamed protein product [Closterium sp. Naga37s-1]